MSRFSYWQEWNTDIQQHKNISLFSIFLCQVGKLLREKYNQMPVYFKSYSFSVSSIHNHHSSSLSSFASSWNLLPYFKLILISTHFDLPKSSLLCIGHVILSHLSFCFECVFFPVVKCYLLRKGGIGFREGTSEFPGSSGKKKKKASIIEYWCTERDHVIWNS